MLLDVVSMSQTAPFSKMVDQRRQNASKKFQLLITFVYFGSVTHLKESTFLIDQNAGSITHPQLTTLETRPAFKITTLCSHTGHIQDSSITSQIGKSNHIQRQ